MENSHNNCNSKNSPIFNNGHKQENRINDAVSEEIDRVEDCSDDEDNKNHYTNQGPHDGHPLYKTPNLLSIPKETQENQNYAKHPPQYAPTFSCNNNANKINSNNVSTFFSNDNDYTNNMVHPFQHSDVVRQNRNNVCGTNCPIGPYTSLQGPNCNYSGLQNNPNTKPPTGFPTFSPSPINQWQTPSTVVDYGFSVHDKNRYKGGNRRVSYSTGNNSPNPFYNNDARSPRNRSGCRSPAAAPAAPFNTDIYRSNNESLQNFSQSCPGSPCDCDCGPCDSPTQTYNDCINNDTGPCPCTCPCENCDQRNICAGNCDCNCCRQDCYSSPCDCCNTCCNNDCCCSPFSSCCPPSCFPYGCGIDPWNPCCYSSAGPGQFCCPGQCCGGYPSCYPPSCHTTCIQPSPYCSPVRISVGTGACPCDCQCPFPCGCPCPCPCPCDCNKPPCCCPDTPPPPEGWYISGYKLYNVEPRILGYKCTYEIRKKRTIIRRNMCGGIISIEDGDCPTGSKSKSCTNLLAATKSRSNSQESHGSDAGEDGDAE